MNCPLRTGLRMTAILWIFVVACSTSTSPGTTDDTNQSAGLDANTAADVMSDTTDQDGAVDPSQDALGSDATTAPGQDTTTGPSQDATDQDGAIDPSQDALGPDTTTGPALSCLEDDGVVIPTPDAHSNYKNWGFDRYAEVVAPNGKPIRIFATAQVTDEMVHRARNVLRFFLTDVEGSQYGSDKSAVANSMADHGATLMLPGGAHQEGNEPPFNAQPLYEAEMTVEGGDWYLTNDWEHRDATFEEIFHLVHDAGIGTYMPGALPAYQAELLAEALAAIDDGRWGIPVDPGVQDWLEELAEEDSLAQEYIASVIDSYYGYWGAFDEGPGGMWGIYIAKTRDEITEKDPAGLALLEAFLPSMAHYEARLASTFTGTFAMDFAPSQPYTHKSRYLVQVTLTGSNPASIAGNEADNVLRGNGSDNTLDGAGGDDTAIYCQPRSAYTVSMNGFDMVVQGPDGQDTLRSIESVHFADGVYPAATLAE